jgi:gamma-glutamyltranspeptidase / glutathione hydrolase / leukotriene-C4 hydrolase
VEEFQLSNIMRKNLIVGLSVLLVVILCGLGIGLYFFLKPSPQGAVATGTDECTEVAVEILKRGGSVVDSAVTATLCQGITVPQSAGLGGGFLATIYIKKSGTFETINAREVAPSGATKNMYQNDLSSREGGYAVAVPTELKGLFELHKKYGKLKWEEVVLPAAQIAENGFKVTKYLSEVFRTSGDKIKSKPGFR